MSFSRRHLLAGGATALAFSGFARNVLAQQAGADTYRNEIEGYGPLITDPLGICDLPEGFSYRVVSQFGETMSDGLLSPGQYDGMGCFPVEGHPTRVALVRNHELDKDDLTNSAFGAGHHLAGRVEAAKVYDRDDLDRPLAGGTTTVIYDLAEGRTLSQHLSLAGTSTNCAGGATPWGSWLTCEETTIKAGQGVQQDHGWVFEVPSSATGLVDPVPLRAMGRFDHEAACVDPETGVVYLTEDEDDSLLYRFIPNTPGRLAEGGRLQALAIVDEPSADLRNWNGRISWARGDWKTIRWIDLEDVESPNGDLRRRGHAAGGALFARGEGLAWAEGDFFFTCTSGGASEFGQIMRVRVGRDGTEDRIELFLESGDDMIYDYGDNLIAAPWGHLLVCEDRYSDEKNHLRGVTPDGEVYTIARNMYEGNAEFCGVCVSPDGSTVFINIQNGLTLAITGPWSSLQNS